MGVCPCGSLGRFQIEVSVTRHKIFERISAALPSALGDVAKTTSKTAEGDISMEIRAESCQKVCVAATHHNLKPA